MSKAYYRTSKSSINGDRLTFDGNVIKINSITRALSTSDKERVEIEGYFLYKKHGKKDPSCTYAIEDVKFDDPITVVYWKDGTQTIVDSFGEKYDKRTELLTAIFLKRLGIKKIIFSDPATVIFWNDNTKTVVKCQPGDEYDPLLGFLYAITEKSMGIGKNCNQIIDNVVEGKKEEPKAAVKNTPIDLNDFIKTVSRF